ncbi:MAG TPA: hypothetical protein VFZ01_04815 [Geminicoccaceae bacterium]
MSLVDIDQLERLLIEAARHRRTLTYAEVLQHFGKRITPRRAYALSRDLGEVCRRNRERGEPELAVLVVRKSDGLPGEGFFRSAWRDGTYDGPALGFPARNFIREQQDRVFRFFVDEFRRAASEDAEQGQDQDHDHDQADQIDDIVHGEAPLRVS